MIFQHIQSSTISISFFFDTPVHHSNKYKQIFFMSFSFSFVTFTHFFTNTTEIKTLNYLKNEGRKSKQSESETHTIF
jgi:hypothetical protein